MLQLVLLSTPVRSAGVEPGLVNTHVRFFFLKGTVAFTLTLGELRILTAGQLLEASFLRNEASFLIFLTSARARVNKQSNNK